MADFTRTLETGNYYLPSNIFPDEGSVKFSGDTENRAQELPAYAIRVHNRASAKPLPNLEFGPGGQYGMVGAPGTGVGFGHNLSAYGTGGFRGGSRPVYQYHQPIKPAQAQVESFGQASARLLERRQNQKRGRFLPVPVQVNRTGLGGIARDYRGTGVFLPRVVHNDTKKNPSMKSEELNQSKKNNIVGKQGKAFEHPSEICLPQEWTY